jgi:transposase
MSWFGLDVAKRSVTAAKRDEQKILTHTFPLTRQGFDALLAWLDAHPGHACLEPTGPYWLPLAEWLEQAGIAYALANPRNVRHFARASRFRSKTDPIDAEILLHFGETFQPDCVTLPQGPLRALRAISRRILQLQLQLDVERDRRSKLTPDAATPAAVLDSFEATSAQLRALIAQLEREAKSLIHSQPELRNAYRLLLSIPGLGPKTVRTLLAEYGPRLLTASEKQLTSFAGLDVVLHESGSSVSKRPRISKQGNWRIRRALYLAALTASRYNPDLKAFYTRKREQGLRGKQALMAVARKLLHQTHGVLKNQTTYQTQGA